MDGWVVLEGTGDVFDALRENHRARVDAEVRELALIARACDEYTVDGSRADVAAERLIQGGADGTAHVGEFLALELAGLLECSPTSAALRIRETLDLRDRHPELWAFTMAGGVAPWRALKVAARCASAGLSSGAARWVDHQLGLALAVLPWSRASRALEGLIVTADAALAAERAREKREARGVFIGAHSDGGSELFARVDTADALALQRTIGAVADALARAGNLEPIDQRRATALGVLADPQAAADLLAGAGDGRPTNRTATLVVHIAADSLAEAPASRGAARVGNVGPLDPETLRRFLADSQVVVRPTVDLNTVPTVDAYEIPERLRRHVLARNPVEAFPFSARPAARLDLDHTVPFDHQAPRGANQTRASNLGPLGRRVHRAKTSRRWRVEQSDPGVFVWTSPHGFRYEVTPEGPVALGRDPARLPRAGLPRAG